MDYWWIRRHWSAIVARWLQILWWCFRCSYRNIATDRCFFCGSRPPRPVREEIASVPVPPRQDLSPLR